MRYSKMVQERSFLLLLLLIPACVDIRYILTSFSTHLQYSGQILGFYRPSLPLPLNVPSFLMQDELS